MMEPVICLVENQGSEQRFAKFNQGTSDPLPCLFFEFKCKGHNIRQHDIIRRNGHVKRDPHACEMFLKKGENSLRNKGQYGR